MGKGQQLLKSAPYIRDASGARREVVEGSWESCQVSHFWQLCHTFLQFRIWLCRRKTCRFLLEVFLTCHLRPLWHSWAGNVEYLLPVGSQAGRSSWEVEVAAAYRQDHFLLSSLPLLHSRWLKQPRVSRELPITPQLSRFPGSPGLVLIDPHPSSPSSWEHLFQVPGLCSSWLCPYPSLG